MGRYTEIIFLVFLGSLLSCGGKIQDAQRKIQPIRISLQQSGTSLNFAKEDSNLAAPGGVTPTAIVVSLSGCSSGLAGTNSHQTYINTYLYDTNCLGKLTSFTVNGLTYVPSGTGSVPFTTWLAGNAAVFVSGTSLAYVQVVSQLSSPIQGTDVLSYSFSFITLGANSAAVTVSQATNLYVSGTNAPNFKINSAGATLTNILSSGVSTGAGVFSFQVTCTTGPMTAGAGADSIYNSFCPDTVAGGLFSGGATGVDIGGTYFSVKLIPDANGNGTLTLAQAQATFAAGGDTTLTLPGAILSGSTGFQAVALSGPVPISTNPKMILVLQAKNANPIYSSNSSFSSFEYFPFTLPTVSP